MGDPNAQEALSQECSTARWIYGIRSIFDVSFSSTSLLGRELS